MIENEMITNDIKNSSTINKFQIKLLNDMTSDGIVNQRYYHSLEVAKKCLELNSIHHLGLDEEKLYIAGLLHDCSKLKPKTWHLDVLYKLGYQTNDEIMKAPNVWHGETGVFYAKEYYHINDDAILDGIKYHVMGKPAMTDFELVVFVADFVEDTRVGPMFEKARRIANIDLIDSVTYIIEQIVKYIKDKSFELISQTEKTYNYYKVVENGKK